MLMKSRESDVLYQCFENFFCKGLDSEYFRFCAPRGLSHNYSPLPLVAQKSQRYYVSLWTWPCYNKTLLKKAMGWIWPVGLSSTNLFCSIINKKNFYWNGSYLPSSSCQLQLVDLHCDSWEVLDTYSYQWLF